MTAVRRFFNRPAVVMGGLLLVFFVPVVAAWVLFANIEQWRPMGTTNHGELVAPARPLADFTLQGLDGAPVGDDYLRGKWTLVYIADSLCLEQCRARLHDLRQVRLALGADANRVQRLLVLSDQAEATALQGVLQDYPGMAVATAGKPESNGFLQSFDSAGGAGRVYIVDPLGNLMMSYPPGAPPKGVLKDLQRLLKVSQIG